MVLRKRNEEQGQDIPKEIKPELNPFLTLIEHKKKESKTIYFEDKHQPSKMDCEIFEDISSKNADKLMNAEDFPNLFNWFNLIGTFSPKIRNNWN